VAFDDFVFCKTCIVNTQVSTHQVQYIPHASQPKHGITSLFKTKSQTAGSELRHQQTTKPLHAGPYYDSSLLQKQIPLLPLHHFLNKYHALTQCTHSTLPKASISLGVLSVYRSLSQSLRCHFMSCYPIGLPSLVGVHLLYISVNVFSVLSNP
jgi:hypothetical protein